jgi:hypothetical protein
MHQMHRLSSASALNGRADAAAEANNLLDFGLFFATVQHQRAGLVFAIRPLIFCQPNRCGPVSNPKGF